MIVGSSSIVTVEKWNSLLLIVPDAYIGYEGLIQTDIYVQVIVSFLPGP